jgi:hypothetical protein
VPAEDGLAKLVGLASLCRPISWRPGLQGAFGLARFLSVGQILLLSNIQRSNLVG